MWLKMMMDLRSLPVIGSAINTFIKYTRITSLGDRRVTSTGDVRIIKEI